MNSDDKTFAIVVVSIFVGAVGSLVSVWALPCAMLAIIAISAAKKEPK